MRWNSIIGVAALPFAAACAVVETSHGPVVTVSASTIPLDLALGDTARILITVRNLGSRMVEVTDGGCNELFFISDSDGNAYNQAEQVYCTLDLRAPLELAPGQLFQFEAFTTGRVVAYGEQTEPIMLSAGTYRVRPVVLVRSGDEDAVIVSATPMKVTFR